MQNGIFIAYSSRKHKIHKDYYPAHDFQLEEVVFVLTIWRKYL